jgi:hypothetical protein
MDDLNAASWHRLSLGDANMADDEMDDLRIKFEQERSRAAATRGMALFRRLESRGDVHCDLVVYFPPQAAGLARRCNASPCAQPARHGLDMVIGGPEDWDLLLGLP